MLSGTCLALPTGLVRFRFDCVLGFMITKNTIDQHVGARLRSLRENRGMTAESLATTIGIPASRLADLEEGRERIAANLMRPLARALARPIHGVRDFGEVFGRPDCRRAAPFGYFPV